MIEKPLPQDEPGAQERFDRGIKAALATPPKPHKKPSGSVSRLNRPRAPNLGTKGT
jgi:hypothetical protein